MRQLILYIGSLALCTVDVWICDDLEIHFLYNAWHYIEHLVVYTMTTITDFVFNIKQYNICEYYELTNLPSPVNS